MKPRLLSLFFIVACAALLAQNYSPTGLIPNQGTVGTASWSDAMTLTSAGTLAIAALNNTGASFTFNGHTCTIVSTVVTCP
jgi:hypothetical protein